MHVFLKLNDAGPHKRNNPSGVFILPSFVVRANLLNTADTKSVGKLRYVLCYKTCKKKKKKKKRPY